MQERCVQKSKKVRLFQESIRIRGRIHGRILAENFILKFIIFFIKSQLTIYETVITRRIDKFDVTDRSSRFAIVTIALGWPHSSIVHVTRSESPIAPGQVAQCLCTSVNDNPYQAPTQQRCKWMQAKADETQHVQEERQRRRSINQKSVPAIIYLGRFVVQESHTKII